MWPTTLAAPAKQRAAQRNSPAGETSSRARNSPWRISWLNSTAATLFKKSPTKVSRAGSFPTLRSTLVMPALPLPWSRMSLRW